MHFLWFILPLVSLTLADPVPAGKKDTQAYQPYPSLRVLQCCTGITGGVAGAGTALGNGCKSDAHS